MAKLRKIDRWSLRPGDLPPEWILDREPCLSGLADNPFFRLLMGLGRGGSKEETVTGSGLALGVLVILASTVVVPSALLKRERSIFVRDLSGSSVAGLIFTVWQVLWLLPFSTFLPPVAKRLDEPINNLRRFLFSVQPKFMMPLALAGYPAYDMALGAWGKTLKSIRLCIRFWMGWPALCFWLGVTLVGTQEMRLWALFPAFVSSHIAILEFFSPYSSLPFIRFWTIQELHKQESLFSWFSKGAPIFPTGISYVIVTTAAIFLNIHVVTHWVELNPDVIVRFATSPLSGIAVSLLGGTLGWAQGSYCKRNADRLIQQITDDIALAMKLWIEREGERLGLHDLR